MRRLLAIVALVLWTMTANATQLIAAQLIVDQRPYYSRYVAGTVTDPVGYAMAGVTVRMVRCDASPEHAEVLKQTISDVHGVFGFGRFSSGKACLLFSKEGFDVVRITVLHSADAPDLALKLPRAS